MPDLSDWDEDVLAEPSTTMAKLTIPPSIFESDVGKITKVLLLLAELVSCLRDFFKAQHSRR